MKQEYPDKQLSAHRERQAAAYHMARAVWLESYVKAEQASESLRLCEMTSEGYCAALRSEDVAYDAFLVAENDLRCSDASCLATADRVPVEQIVEIRRRTPQSSNEHQTERAL